MCFGTLHLTGNKSWRIPCYFQVLGPSCILLLTATIAESPRWLVSKGRLDQARTILARAHANGDENDPLVNLECEEIEAAIKEESEMPKKGYWDLFNNGPNRRRIAVAWTVAVGTNWVGNGVISYYLTPVLKSLGITKSIQTELINCGLQIWNLILSTGAAIWCERIGRRPLWLISTIGMLFSMSIVMGLSAGFANTGTQHIGTAVIPFLFVSYSLQCAEQPLIRSDLLRILRHCLDPVDLLVPHRDHAFRDPCQSRLGIHHRAEPRPVRQQHGQLGRSRQHRMEIVSITAYTSSIGADCQLRSFLGYPHHSDHHHLLLLPW